MNQVLDAHEQARRPLDLQGQQPRRDRERLVREESLAFARWAHRQGLPRCRAAVRLDINPGTLGRWDRSWHAHRLKAHPLGSSRRRADARQCMEVAHCLQEAGPTVGLRALRSQFPDLARSQLADLQHQYRYRWFHAHEIFADVLEWLVPGSVWATDFSQSPVIIDGVFRHVLAVRDLASRRQLLLLPAQQADALTALGAMEHLFATCGPPLVLKSDNGSPFIADIFTKLMRRWGVTSLLSPPHWPPYNGSIEAGFGASKTRIHFEAVRHGRFNHWLLDDVEAARQLANCASRPWGVTGPTPQER